jgi:hypothetical protein
MTHTTKTRSIGNGWLRPAALLLLLAGLSATALSQEPPAEAPPADIAVIVHPDNPLQDVKLAQLRGYLRLDRQFWPDRTRVVLFLPPADSPAKQVLNDELYKMDEKKLRKYWVGKVFAGDIPAVPQVVKTSSAAGRVLVATEGAVSAVPADEVPEGVRVLKIDGLSPGDKGYPLKGKPKSAPPVTTADAHGA